MRQRIAIVSLLALLALTFTFGQGVAFASSGRGGASPSNSQVGSSSKSSCYVRIVYLHGSNPATSICKVPKKPHNPIPFFSSVPCGDGLPYPWVSLYQDAGYGGAQICFAGRGSDNLNNYWIFWPFTSWDKQTSSFNMGAYGYLSTSFNGSGNHCSFHPGSETSYINNICGSGWNDAARYVNISG